jgi:hypothetical protein
MSFGLDFVEELKNYYVSNLREMTLLEMFSLIDKDIELRKTLEGYGELVHRNILRAHYIQFQHALLEEGKLNQVTCLNFLKSVIQKTIEELNLTDLKEVDYESLFSDTSLKLLREKLINTTYDKFISNLIGTFQLNEIIESNDNILVTVFIPDRAHSIQAAFPTALLHYCQYQINNTGLVRDIVTELLPEPFVEQTTYQFTIFEKKCIYGKRCYRKDKEHKAFFGCGVCKRKFGFRTPLTGAKRAGKTIYNKGPKYTKYGKRGKVGADASGGFRKVSKKRKSKKSSKRIVKSRKRPNKSRKRKLK